MTYRLTVDQVLLIHGELHCTEGLTNRGALEGALAAPFVELIGYDPYPSVIEKAAKLLDSLARAHAFGDGNKRVAWMTCLQFLQAHGLDLQDIPDTEAAGFVDLVASDHGTGVDEIAEWLLDRLE